MSIELNDISSGYSTGLINENFQKLEQYINDNLLNRDGTEVGEPNQMENNLDMNGNLIINPGTDINESGSLLTVGAADGRYVNVTGDTLAGALDMAGNAILVRAPQATNEPARLLDLQEEANLRLSGDNSLQAEIDATEQDIRTGYQDGDASLQSQISGLTEIAAAERPIIQWHGQEITNSITIPDDVNAFTVGPSIAVAQGQSITVGANSFWTIVDGTEVGDVVVGSIDSFDEGTL